MTEELQRHMDQLSQKLENTLKEVMDLTTFIPRIWSFCPHLNSMNLALSFLFQLLAGVSKE